MIVRIWASLSIFLLAAVQELLGSLGAKNSTQVKQDKLAFIVSLKIPITVISRVSPTPPSSNAQESPDVASKQVSHPDRWGPLAGFEGRG